MHPFMHDKIRSAVFHSLYRWVEQLPERRLVPWNAEALEEICAAALLLLTAEAEIRRPLSCGLTLTDASQIASGSTRCVVGPRLAQGFYDVAEQRGERVVLSGVHGAGPTSQISSNPLYPYPVSLSWRRHGS